MVDCRIVILQGDQTATERIKMTYSIETTPATVIAALAVRNTLDVAGYSDALWSVFEKYIDAIGDHDYFVYYTKLHRVFQALRG